MIIVDNIYDYIELQEKKGSLAAYHSCPGIKTSHAGGFQEI